MPRRNRNAHALSPDIDRLADQARQLTTELCQPARTNNPASGIGSPSLTTPGSFTEWFTGQHASTLPGRTVITHG